MSATQTRANSDTTNQPPRAMNMSASTDQAARTAGTLNSDQPRLAAGASERPRATAVVTASSHTRATAGVSQRTTAACSAAAAGAPDSQAQASHSMAASSTAATPTQRMRDGGCGTVRRSHSQAAQAAAAASKATNHQGLPEARAAARTASRTAAVRTRWPSMVSPVAWGLFHASARRLRATGRWCARNGARGCGTTRTRHPARPRRNRASIGR